MYKLTILFISILLLASFAGKAQHKIIWEVPMGDTAQQRILYRQVNNVLAAAPDTKIELVFHGTAIYAMLKDTGYHKEQILALHKKGVVFAACNNSLKNRNIDPQRVMQAAIIVPSALVEMVKKQEKRWAYIKAGS